MINSRECRQRHVWESARTEPCACCPKSQQRQGCKSLHTDIHTSALQIIFSHVHHSSTPRQTLRILTGFLIGKQRLWSSCNHATHQHSRQADARISDEDRPKQGHYAANAEGEKGRPCSLHIGTSLRALLRIS